MAVQRLRGLGIVEQLAVAAVAFFAIVCAFAPWIAPYDPYDLARIDVLDSLHPPIWAAGGSAAHVLGADDQGRDLLSLIIYGTRSSLCIGVLAALASAAIGVLLGLAAAWFGGITDTIIMRTADVKMSFPAILIALLVEGVSRIAVGPTHRPEVAAVILIVAISLSHWVQFARTIRASALVEIRKEYVQAATVLGIAPASVVFRHVLPNVTGPILVIGTLNLALAIITEATLSFLGVGLPTSQPSLGTLVRIGEGFLFSGEWWISLFPALTLALLITSINVLGDRLREANNPRGR
jgi:peptide/nickel transport system permease protein